MNITIAITTHNEGQYITSLLGEHDCTPLTPEENAAFEALFKKNYEDYGF